MKTWIKWLVAITIVEAVIIVILIFNSLGWMQYYEILKHCYEEGLPYCPILNPTNPI